MAEDGRRRAPRGTVVRPLLLFTAGLLASLALWRVLVAEPPRPAAQLSRHDRPVPERLLESRQSP